MMQQTDVQNTKPYQADFTEIDIIYASNELCGARPAGVAVQDTIFIKEPSCLHFPAYE